MAEPEETPPEPTNVRAEMPDGTIIPLQLYYWGKANAMHRWDSVDELPVRPKMILADVLPPHTFIHPRVRPRYSPD